MNLKLVLILLLLTGFTYQINAGVFIEPYIGMVDGDSDDNDGDTSDDYDIGGTGYGLRLGYDHFGILLGGVYDIANPEGENKQNSNIKIDYEFKNMGVFLGYQFSWVRLWYSYYLKSELELSNIQGNAAIAALLNRASYEGNKWSLGLGITPIDYLNVFAEIHSYTYDNNKTRTGITIAETSSAYWLLGVSFPFDFGK